MNIGSLTFLLIQAKKIVSGMLFILNIFLHGRSRFRERNNTCSKLAIKTIDCGAECVQS